jgi:DNA-binding MarR family transcriptional regulator
MARLPDPPPFGELLRRPPDSLTIAEAAQALRIPVTTLGDFLRRRPEGIPLTGTQGRALSQLSAGDSLTVSTLAQSQDLAVSSMTEVIVRLADSGFVRKAPSPDDRREVRVSITAAGRRHLANALQARTEVLIARLEQLTEAERTSLVAALPALWRLSELDPDIWPRIREKPTVTRRRTAPAKARAAK